MRNYKEGEDYRDYLETNSVRSNKEVKSAAGGEATDPQLMLRLGVTRVSADKAVAPYIGEVPWDE